MLKLEIDKDFEGEVSLELDTTQCEEMPAIEYLNLLENLVNKAKTIVNKEAQKKFNYDVIDKIKPKNQIDYIKSVNWQTVDQQMRADAHWGSILKVWEVES